MAIASPVRSTATVVPHTTAATGQRARWAGRVISALMMLLLAWGAVLKLFPSPEIAAGTAAMGWQPHHLLPLGVIEVACLVIYLVPRTAVLGAVLWTGYLGGAVATNLRMDAPVLTGVLMPVYVGVLVWLGLYLRDPRVRALVRR